MVFRTAAYDNMLDRLVRSGELSRAGKEWLVCATDPFHDTETHCTGYPDDNAAPSVVRLVKKTVTIQKPSTVTSGTWDAHIVAYPYLQSVNLAQRSYRRPAIVDINTGTGSFPFGGVTAIGVATGSPTGLPDVIGTASASLGQCTLESTFFTGPSRVVAMGFEVTNVTAAIDAQGQVITYRNPYPHQPPQAFSLTDGTSITGAQSLVVTPEHPSTPGTAMVLTGSRQWHAKLGCYVPMTFNSIVIPPTGLSDSSVAHTDDNSTTVAFTPTPAGGALGASNLPQVYTAPLNQAGAYFTGLSLTSTLAISLNVWVETFPDVSETDLMPLASPSPCYDVLALELYSAAMRDMPTGVPVGQNGLGDWFAGIVKKVTSVAKLIPHPVAQGLGVLGEVVGDPREASQTYYDAPRRAPKRVQFTPRALPPVQRTYNEGMVAGQDSYTMRTGPSAGAPRRQAKGSRPRRRSRSVPPKRGRSRSRSRRRQ